MITDFFDNSVGDKTDPASYLKIAEKVRRSVGSMLFITDNPKGNLLNSFEFFGYSFYSLQKPRRPSRPAARPSSSSARGISRAAWRTFAAVFPSSLPLKIFSLSEGLFS